MQKIHWYTIVIFLFCILTISCNETMYEPKEPESWNGPIPSNKLPYIPPPQIYIPIDFTRMMCGVTITDTIVKEPPGYWSATFTTLSGDSEQILLGVISGSFIEGYTGFGGEIPYENSTGKTIDNGILEINGTIDRIMVTYESFNDKKENIYSIVISNSILFYPQRWNDRSP